MRDLQPVKTFNIDVSLGKRKCMLIGKEKSLTLE